MDLVTFSEKILNVNLHFCTVSAHLREHKCIQNLVKYLRWSFLQKYLTVEVINYFLQKDPF